MKRDTINIKGESYQVGFSFRAIREYEILTGQSISKCESTWDNLLFFFCTLKALNKHFTMSVDEFVDTMDEEKDLLMQFQATAVEPQPGPATTVKKKLQNKQIFGLWMLSLLLLASPIWIPIISMIAWIGLSLRLLVRLIAKIGKRPACRS